MPLAENRLSEAVSVFTYGGETLAKATANARRSSAGATFVTLRVAGAGAELTLVARTAIP